jgi:sugar phosphate isomerase/epimerase
MITIYCFKFNMPPLRCYDLMKQVGFDGVSMMWDETYGGADFRDAPKLAQKAGLLIDSIHAPFEGMNCFWQDNASGEAHAEMFLRFVDDCAVRDVPVLVMHVNYGSEPPPLTELGLGRFIRLLEHAEKKGVKLALENMRNVSQLLQTGTLLERFDSPNLGFCFDSGHHNARLSPSPECDLLTRFGHRLLALHLHDNKGIVTGKNEDDMHLLPFDGTVDWAETMKAITATGYKGAVSLEVCDTGYENLTAEEFLREAYGRAEKLAAMR